MTFCWFCKKDRGTFIVEPEYNAHVHIECLIGELNDGNDEAQIMAYGLGYNIKMTDKQETSLIQKAMTIYYNPHLDKKTAVEHGMIPEADLKHGEFYVGFSKRSHKGIWDENERCFHCLDKVYFKAGYFLRGRFEDSFVPVL
jgi:hypothetical protein